MKGETCGQFFSPKDLQNMLSHFAHANEKNLFIKKYRKICNFDYFKVGSIKNESSNAKIDLIYCFYTLLRTSWCILVKFNPLNTFLWPNI